MMTYQQFEKAVFDWLMSKHQANNTFTFSVRQKAMKGAERDYFIGTEKSKYFGTTFWNVPVYFPGSSRDFIDLFFHVTKSGYSYSIGLQQTNTPTDAANEYALELLGILKPAIHTAFAGRVQAGGGRAMDGCTIKPRSQEYGKMEALLHDADADVKILLPIVDDKIDTLKKKYPDFKARRITLQEFSQHQEKLTKRQQKSRGFVVANLLEQIDIQTPIAAPLKSVFPLNQIFFGAPGTGKTYHTVNQALKILGHEIENKERETIKEIYDGYVQEGQIVFTTFHQSMSYEDFVEGIKPIVPREEGQPVVYKIIDGIFKRACAMAGYNCYKLFERSRKQSSAYSFDALYDAFVAYIEDQIGKGTSPMYKTLRGREISIKEVNGNGSIIASAKNSMAKRPAPLTKENLQKLYDTFESFEDIVELQQVQAVVEVTPRLTEFYAVFGGLKEFEKTYKLDKRILEEIGESEALNMEEIQKKFNSNVFAEAIKTYSTEANPVVLIIDEINRGNVSQIFGELITLIEEDKRLGEDEALEVTLPYSKEQFGVPSNLYIIGTMNTADRSVEALDAALRRRFSFEEMPPRPEVLKEKNIEGIHLQEMLIVINSRIEKLLDKDHLIGHSYFLNVEDIQGVKRVFQNNIIPLLQEYFFGDYGKIGLILGQGFVERKKDTDKLVFAVFEGYDDTDFTDRPVYQVNNAATMTNEEFVAAVNTLLRKSNAA
jgi:hypothetical protein